MKLILQFILLFTILSLVSGHLHNIAGQSEQDQQGNQTGVGQQGIELFTDIGIPIIIALAGIGGAGLVTHLVGPIMQEKFSLRKEYYVDYRKWCSDMCGAIAEYRYLVKEIVPEMTEAVENSYDNYLIVHFWEIHNTISTGHKWVGKLYKETFGKDRDREHYKMLRRFIEYTDTGWHTIVNKYPDLVKYTKGQEALGTIYEPPQNRTL